MTKITIRKSGSGYTGFTCLGHSGYAEHGSDIVCSAVSVLVITTINAVERFTQDRMEVVTDEKRGLIDVSFPDVPGKDATLLLDSMLLGLKQVEEQYGERFLSIHTKEG